MRHIAIVLLALCVRVSTARVLMTTTCPPASLDSVANFNLKKYISTPWYTLEQVRISAVDRGNNWVTNRLAAAAAAAARSCTATMHALPTSMKPHISMLTPNHMHFISCPKKRKCLPTRRDAAPYMAAWHFNVGKLDSQSPHRLRERCIGSRVSQEHIHHYLFLLLHICMHRWLWTTSPGTHSTVSQPATSQWTQLICRYGAAAAAAA